MATIRWGGLRPEPYDPDAVDADGDGIVQEGTAFERPAGTRLLNEIGQEIARGTISPIRPQGMRVVDRSGKDIDYTPTYGKTPVPDTSQGAPTKPQHLGAPSLADLGLPSLGTIVHGQDQPAAPTPSATPTQAIPVPPAAPEQALPRMTVQDAMLMWRDSPGFARSMAMRRYIETGDPGKLDEQEILAADTLREALSQNAPLDLPQRPYPNNFAPRNVVYRSELGGDYKVGETVDFSIAATATDSDDSIDYMADQSALVAGIGRYDIMSTLFVIRDPRGVPLVEGTRPDGEPLIREQIISGKYRVTQVRDVPSKSSGGKFIPAYRSVEVEYVGPHDFDTSEDAQPPILRLPESAQQAPLVDVSTFVASRLNPKEEISEDGTPRSIFELDGATFTFKSFLESPVYPTLSTSDVEIIGADRLPGGGSLEDDAARYADTVSELRSTTPAGKHYVVDRTPDGMLELALRFDPENKELQSLRDEIRSGVYSDQGILLLDAMAAAVSMNSDGNLMPDENPNPDGDGLVLLALLGDAEAQADLASRVAKLHAIDAEQEEKRVREVRAEYDRVPPPELGAGEKTPSTDDFSLVHTLRYEPKRDEDGNVVLQTRFDADGFSRASLHTTVNHMVEGHLMGNWDDTQFVVVMPMTDLVEKNGAPANLNAIDSWWLRDPGEKLVAPKAIILKPSSDESAELSADVGDDIFYKVSNFTPEDAATIVNEMFGKGGVESDKLSDEVSAEIAEAIAEFREDPNAYLSGFVSDDDKEQIAEIIAGMLEKDPSRVESTLRYLSKRRAFNLALERQQVARARPSGWQTNQSPRLAHVAKELDVVPAIHSNSPEGRFETTWWEKRDPIRKIPNFPPNIDPKTRRVVVASGVMATRRPAKRVSDEDDYVPPRRTL